MRRIGYRFLAAIRGASTRVGTGALARPGRAKLGTCLRSRQLWIRQRLQCAALMTLMIALTNATAETRPHYGGTLRVSLQSAPDTPTLPQTPPPTPHWASARSP